MSYMPVRGGTRGGKDQFEWDDVKADKHRENYLGHSLMAPVGRWQKGKDLTWYNKKSKVMGQKEILRAEIAAVKKAEEEAMATALGLKPKTLGSGTVSKEELAEVCRRQSVEEKEEAGEERMKGLGYMSRRLSHLNSNQTAATGVAMFESKPVHEGETRSSRVEADSPQPQIPPPSSHPPTKSAWVERTSDTHRSKERKKKTKKEKSKKKHRRKRRKHRHNGSSSESESEEDTSRDRRRRTAARSDSEEGQSGRGRRRNEVESDSDSEERRRRKRKRRKGEGTESNDDRGRKRKGEGTESDDDRGRRRGKTQSGREGEKRRREPSSESEDDDAGQTRHRHHHGGEKRTHKVPTRHRHDSSSD